MSLRLTLLCAGVVILIGVFLYTRGTFQSLFARRPKASPRPAPDERQEPLLESEGGATDAVLADDAVEPAAFGRLHQVGQVEPPEAESAEAEPPEAEPPE